MTGPFLLPALALIAAPAQDQPADISPAPPMTAQAGNAPSVVQPPSEAASPPPPELDDPLNDPENTQAPQAASPPLPKDPLEGFNRAMFGLHESLDKPIYRPLAMGYKQVVPKPVRSGVRNFLSNLTEPVVFLNDLLQLKIGKGGRTLARFTINSTLGLGGLFDVAKRKDFKLPHRDNGFGNTLAYYGVGPGPYIFLPLIGPSTLRDTVGSPVDGSVLPLAIGKPFNSWRYQIVSGAISGLDERAEADPELRALFDGAVDRYATLRSVWLQNRAAEVRELHHHRSQPKGPSELDDPLQDPDTPAPAAVPR